MTDFVYPYLVSVNKYALLSTLTFQTAQELYYQQQNQDQWKSLYISSTQLWKWVPDTCLGETTPKSILPEKSAPANK